MTTQSSKRSKLDHHFRYKTDFEDDKSNIKFQQNINELKKSLMKENRMPVDCIGFTLPSLFASSLNLDKEEQKKSFIKNIENTNRQSTQRSDKKQVLKQKMIIPDNRQSKLEFKQSGFFQNRSQRQSMIKFPLPYTHRRSIMGQHNFLASISSNRSSYARDYSLIRSPCKFLKGKFLIDSSPLLFDSISDEGIKSLKQDISLVKKIFQSNCIYDSQFFIQRQYYSEVRQEIGKLLLFMGIQIAYNLQRDMLGDQWLQKMTKCLHYQIYYSILMKVYPIALQSLVQCSRLHISKKQYDKSQFFCEVALKISVRQSNEYYQQTSLDQISFCQYKLGNIDKAKVLHDNTSKLSLQSRARIVKSYNQSKYLAALRQYLFDGSELNTKRNVRLVETIGFHKNQKLKNPDIINPSLAPAMDRLAISKTNRSIHEFKKSQQKMNDMSKQSNQKAIRSIRLKHLHPTKQEQIVIKVADSPKNSDCKKSGVQLNNMYSLKQYQTLNRSRVQKDSTNCEINQRNVRVFRSFLQYVERMVQSELNHLNYNAH